MLVDFLLMSEFIRFVNKEEVFRIKMKLCLFLCFILFAVGKFRIRYFFFIMINCVMNHRLTFNFSFMRILYNICRRPWWERWGELLFFACILSSHPFHPNIWFFLQRFVEAVLDYNNRYADSNENMNDETSMNDDLIPIGYGEDNSDNMVQTDDQCVPQDLNTLSWNY